MVRRNLSSPARLKTVLAVGGIDPSGHAGLFADARVFTDLGIPWKVAATAITAQSETKFYSWEAVPTPSFRAQLLAAGPKVFGVKIGMLATARHLEVLLDWLKKSKPRWIVWDPVLRASTGPVLFRGSPRQAKFRELLALCDVFTPNFPEAEAILGRKISGKEGMKRAATDLLGLGKKNRRLVVLKGGHSGDQKYATDLVYRLQGCTELRRGRRPGSRRGTGCTFASALLSALCVEKDGIEAVRFAKDYVLKKLFSITP